MLEMDPWCPKNGWLKICTFLYSNEHTEAKKIPEKSFPWYHFLWYKKICLNFLKCFLVILQKNFFLAVTNFWTFLMSYSQKFFLRIFIWKKHAKWYQWKNFSGIFLASVCPLEYKNGQIFDRQIFRTSRVTLAHSDTRTK